MLSEKPGGKKKKLMGDDVTITRGEYEALKRIDRVRIVQELIPIALMAVAEELQRDVAETIQASIDPETGRPTASRYGFNAGSVVLGSQRIPIRVPRVRKGSKEVTLESYELFHDDHVKRTLFESLLNGMSCRNYEKTVSDHPGAISKSKSTISRQFAEFSAKQFKAFQERSLEGYDIVAVFIDGKYFGDDQMVIALGVTMEGRKIPLGFVQTASENAQTVGLFLQSLLDRGLRIDQGVLAVTDGSKGLIKALRTTFSKQVAIQRCQWHKRKNVISYLSKADQPLMQQLLQSAYERPTLEEAREALGVIAVSLNRMNQSAAASLAEGLEETLTLHRLDIFGIIGKSFKTSNCLESVNNSIESICKKISSWHNSQQKGRWLASALTQVEPRLHRVQGWEHLPALRAALKKELHLK
jgi:transposase-like protein